MEIAYMDAGEGDYTLLMIHGLGKDWEWAEALAPFFSWTNGCIALSNRDMDRVWEAVDPGTPIEIRP